MQQSGALELYKYDVERASWAIETILTTNENFGAKIHQQWVEGVTRNLFAYPEKRIASSKDKLLGALLDVAAKAEIGPGGPRFEIRKNSLRRLAKKLNNEGDDEQ